MARGRNYGITEGFYMEEHMNKDFYILLMAVSLLAVSCSAEIQILNGSFEEPTYANWGAWQQMNGWNYADATTWNGGYYGGGPRHPDWPTALQAIDGQQMIVIRSFNVWQNTGTQMIAGKTYTFSAYAASENSRAAGFKIAILTTDSSSTTAPLGIEKASAYFSPQVFSNGFAAEPYKVYYTATSADAGKYLQVLICSNPDKNDSIWVDAVGITDVYVPAQAGLLNGSFESPVYSQWTAWGQSDNWNYADNTTWGGGSYGCGPIYPAWPPALVAVDGQQLAAFRQYNLWQNTAIQIEENTTFTLKVHAVSENARSRAFVAGFYASPSPLPSAVLGEEIYSESITPQSWTLGFTAEPYTISYTAKAADAGKYLQVLLCSDPGINDYIIADGISLTYAPHLDGDFNNNHKVDGNDLKVLVSQWLECTDPLGVGCEKDASYEYISYAPASTNVTVDGVLTEWADASWIQMDKNFYETAPDMPSAMYACKWNPQSNVIYLAVKVVDNDKIFLSNEGSYNNWDQQDELNIYCEGTNDNSTGFSNVFNTAQQYAIGPNGSGGTWQLWGTGLWLSDFLPDPGLVTACVVNGNNLSYEAQVVPYDYYSGIVGVGDTVQTTLTDGKMIGFDVVAGSKRADGFGMLCANMMEGKWNDAGKFAKLVCVQNVPTDCGIWGYKDADINKDCYVDFVDFADLASNWLICSDPEGCY